MTITEILEQAKTLTPQERKGLAKLLIDMMDESPSLPQRRLSELRGLGKEIWQAIDAQDYVNQMRNEWDDRQFIEMDDCGQQGNERHNRLIVGGQTKTKKG